MVLQNTIVNSFAGVLYKGALSIICFILLQLSSFYQFGALRLIHVTDVQCAFTSSEHANFRFKETESVGCILCSIF